MGRQLRGLPTACKIYQLSICLALTFITSCELADTATNCPAIARDDSVLDLDLAPVIQFLFPAKDSVLLCTSPGQFIRLDSPDWEPIVVWSQNPDITGFEESITNIVVGSNGALWGLRSTHPLDGTTGEASVAVSHDGGVSWTPTPVNNVLGAPFIVDFIEIPNGDPLFADLLSGQLWQFEPAAESEFGPFTEWGTQNPDGRGGGGI